MNSQIQFETNGLTVLAVKFDKQDKIHGVLGGRICYEHYLLGGYEEMELPEGNWKIHAVTTEMTDEQAKVLVTMQITGGAYNYSIAPHKRKLKEVLRSHGIDPAEKWVLLVKE